MEKKKYKLIEKIYHVLEHTVLYPGFDQDWIDIHNRKTLLGRNEEK